MAFVLAVALGAGHIAARYAGVRTLAGVLKPLPILLLALVVATSGGGAYRWLVVAGLVLSMVGDVLLLFPTRFVAGLASFLTAHLVYIAAFSLGAGAYLLVLVPFVVMAAAMLAVLWQRLGADRGPVLAYITIIAVMGWRAAARALSSAIPEPSGTLGLVGALLFMTSDSVLAVNRFAYPFAAADLVVMTTYYAAQVLIAWSAIV
ncbi:MAG TPA: lysoplasmalogenase [Solirubrobacteraceae bacterium]|jgi:uncharacterized membrane protein YhhN